MPTIKVQGMTCNHCKASVTDAVSKLDGVTAVEVDLLSGNVSWEESAPVDPATIKDAIEAIGFDVVE